MAKRAKTAKLSKQEAGKRIEKIRATLQGIAEELDSLEGNVEGATPLDNIRVATTSWEAKAVAFKLCSNPSSMSFFKKP